jgi:hypothetical protein
MSIAVTMQDLELEHDELLPSRETLCCYSDRCSFIKVEVDIRLTSACSTHPARTDGCRASPEGDARQ